MGVTLGKAVEAVRREWLTNLRYGYIEAHHTSLTESAGILDFVTQIAPGSLYVTDQVEVRARS